MAPMSDIPSRQVLREAPGRVLAFLYGAAADPAVWALLATRGYDEAEHAEGWARLQRACGFGTPAAPRSAAVDAVAKLDAWDEPNFRAYEAALARQFPEQRDFVFTDLTAATGPLSVIGIKTFLDRVAMLESGTNPDGSRRPTETRRVDRAAVDLLVKRGLTEPTRAQLVGWIETAQSLPTPAPVLDDTGASDADDEPTAQDLALLDLHAWWVDWSQSARAVIRKRSQLIRLGLASRRAGKTDGGEDVPPPVTT